MISTPAYPLSATVVVSGQKLFCEFLRTGRVLSPTTYLMPFANQAWITSPLCIPVMAGGIKPLDENLAALSMPVVLNHAWFQEISLLASEPVALLKFKCVKVWETWA